MGFLPKVPFGLRLPGTDGFSLPNGAVPGGSMPAPYPDGMGTRDPYLMEVADPNGGESAFQPMPTSPMLDFQPPPTMPPPPSEPDQLQSRSAQAPMENLPTTPSGGLATTPKMGDSDQKWGLKQWLPLILGTAGAGIWAGKSGALTDFGTNLLQGAAKQTFDQLEEKRKRQFDLDTANLKQGQEAIKDLIAINDNDLVTLQKEIESDPHFAHMAAYIQPLREAKQKYNDFKDPNSDGGMKITAKEAAELSHYYNAIKGAKEAINKFQGQKEQVGFAGQLEAAKDDAKYQSLVEAYKAAGGKTPELLFRIYGGREGIKGISQQQLNNDMRIAAWFAEQNKIPGGWEAVLSNPAMMRTAQQTDAEAMSGARARGAAPYPRDRVVLDPVTGTGRQLSGATEDKPIHTPIDSTTKTNIQTVDSLLSDADHFRRLLRDKDVQADLRSVVDANTNKLVWSRLQGRGDISSKTRALMAGLGRFTAQEIHKVYGGAFTSVENAMKNTWAPDISDSIEKTDAILANLKREGLLTLRAARDMNPSNKDNTIFTRWLDDGELKKKYAKYITQMGILKRTPMDFEAFKRQVGQ